MAVSALTAIRSNVVHGNDRVTVTDVTMDATNYTAGGVALTAANLGLNAVKHATCSIKTVTANGPVACWYDVVNQKLKCNDATAEVGAVSLSGAIVEVVAYGY